MLAIEGAAAVSGGLHLATFRQYEHTLLGAMFVADGAGPHPTLLLLHGFPGTERNFDLAHSVRRAGWNVLVFHYRGSWGSEGDFSFGNALSDAAAALAFLRSAEAAAAYRIDTGRIAVAGHSMGGFIALMSAAADPEVWGAASWAGFNFGAFSRRIAGDEAQISQVASEWDAQARPLRGASGAHLTAEVVAAGERWNLQRTAPALSGKNVLLLAASHDSVAPPALHHDPLVESFRTHNVALTDRILNADHGFTGSRPALTLALLSWLERFATMSVPNDLPPLSS